MHGEAQVRRRVAFQHSSFFWHTTRDKLDRVSKFPDRPSIFITDHANVVSIEKDFRHLICGSSVVTKGERLSLFSSHAECKVAILLGYVFKYHI